MKLNRISAVALVFTLVALLLTASLAAANAPAKLAQSDQMLAIISEETGLIASHTATSPACVFDNGYGVYLCPEPGPSVLPQPDQSARAQAMRLLGVSGLLLIPESTNDRVMAFDPVTGDLVDPDFIPADPTNLSTPIHAILSASGDTILVSDQIDDSVEEYDLNGVWQGEFAGGNTAILDNVRGIALRPNGNLLVTVGSGANSNAVAEFDTTGVYVGNFVAIGSGGLNSPFDVYGRTNDWLVNGITSDAVHRYDLSGNYIANLTAINTFPEQAAEASNTNVLIANFSGTEEGVVEYTATGTQVGIYDPASLGGYRGVYELPNGNILTTNGSGVHEIDRSGNLVNTKISGVSARFIEFVGGASIEIDKSPGYQDVLVNGTAFFTISVTNTSSISLTDVTVSDALTPDCDNAIGQMLPGASTTYSCSNVGVTASFTNTAVVTSTINTQPGPSASDDALVNVLDATLEIEKAPDLQTVNSGGTANFTITVTNSGTIDLINVTVTDALVPSCDTVIAALPAGASSTHTCSDVGVTAAYTNTAVVTGTIDQGLPQPSAMDDAYVDLGGPTAVSVTDFGRNPAAFSPLWLALILGVVLGVGLLLRRRFQN